MGGLRQFWISHFCQPPVRYRDRYRNRYRNTRMNPKRIESDSDPDSDSDRIPSLNALGGKGCLPFCWRLRSDSRKKGLRDPKGTETGK